ncbi:MAG: hypothetical protein P4L84_36895 [Isosphaeraceae bacterium]|nr:hypothetical protein [Isosphaeraceae bacterium]
MALTPIVELGVAEAYALLTGRFGQSDLPPLDAIENEDWGRDFLLSRFHDLPADALAAVGLRLDEPEGSFGERSPGAESRESMCVSPDRDPQTNPKHK